MSALANQFSYISPKLQDRFAAADPSQGQVLKPKTLPRSMTLAQIKDELQPGIVTVHDIMVTIKSDGLRRDGWAELFFLEDWAVRVYWSDGGWDVHAYAVDGPSPWGGGGRVFSRDSGSPLTA